MKTPCGYAEFTNVQFLRCTQCFFLITWSSRGFSPYALGETNLVKSTPTRRTYLTLLSPLQRFLHFLCAYIIYYATLKQYTSDAATAFSFKLVLWSNFRRRSHFWDTANVFIDSAGYALTEFKTVVCHQKALKLNCNKRLPDVYVSV